MNQRILELVKQADPDYGNEHFDMSDSIVGNAAIQKFALLIIRECWSTVAGVPTGYADYRSQIEEGMRTACAEAVLDHWGIDQQDL